MLVGTMVQTIVLVLITLKTDWEEQVLYIINHDQLSCSTIALNLAAVVHRSGNSDWSTKLRDFYTILILQVKVAHERLKRWYMDEDTRLQGSPGK
jgi:hypothetical protein